METPARGSDYNAIANPIPTANRNPAIQAFESWSATTKKIKTTFPNSSIKTAHKKFWLLVDFIGSCSFSRDMRITPLPFMAKPARKRCQGSFRTKFEIIIIRTNALLGLSKNK
jgi:hypothetical protein